MEENGTNNVTTLHFHCMALQIMFEHIQQEQLDNTHISVLQFLFAVVVSCYLCAINKR
jgi:hypothetical protein